nr:immunoglobulin heavy chain junction region [Macaca mulatta]
CARDVCGSGLDYW